MTDYGKIALALAKIDELIVKFCGYLKDLDLLMKDRELLRKLLEEK